MANRFNALILKRPTDDDHHHHYVGIATVRPADIGISDVEWHHGVRVAEHDCPHQTSLKSRMESMDYLVLEADDWIDQLGQLDDPSTIQTNHFVSTCIRADKWDTRPEIY